MEPRVTKEPRRQKSSESMQTREPVVPVKESAHSRPVPFHDDVHARIADRAYELYAERGYRQGHALDDWLEAEREILGHEGNA